MAGSDINTVILQSPSPSRFTPRTMTNNKSIRYSILFAVFILSSIIGYSSTAFADSSNSIINSNVLRNIDISSHIVRETTTVIFSPASSSSSSPVSQYAFVLPADVANSKLAYLSVEEKDSGKKLAIVKGKLDSERNLQYYTAKLASPLSSSSDSLTIRIQSAFLNVLSHYPKEIEMYAQDSIEYRGVIPYVSPYASTKQKTVVKTPNDKIHNYTQADSSKRGSEIVYGPFSDVPALTKDQAPLYVHCQNPSVHLVAKTMERKLEMSQLGNNLNVEEHWELFNRIAGLKGHFSRIDYFKTQRYLPPTVLQSLTAQLPAGVRNPYYKDQVGNVSTSNFRKSLSSSTLQIRPRFPLFGGWKYIWFHGYDVDLSSGVLKHVPGTNKYVLNIKFWENFEGVEVGIEEATLTIALPEGARNPQVYIPFDVDSVSTTKYYTYFDSLGRLKLVIRKRNVIPEHTEQPIQVSYEYDFTDNFRKPIVLTTAVLVLFLVSMAYNRLDLDITKDAKTEAIALLKSHVYTVADTHAAIQKVFANWNMAFQVYRSAPTMSKDLKAFQSARQSFEQNLKQLVDETLLVRIVKQVEQVELPNTSMEKLKSKMIEQLQQLGKMYQEKSRVMKQTQSDVVAFYQSIQGDVDSVDDKKRKAVLASIEKLEADVKALDAKLDVLVSALAW